MGKPKTHPINPQGKWGRIVYLRMRQWKLSQTEMAALLGVTVQRVNDWMHDRTEPDDYYKEHIVNALRLDPMTVAPDWLLGAMMGHDAPAGTPDNRPPLPSHASD